MQYKVKIPRVYRSKATGRYFILAGKKKIVLPPKPASSHMSEREFIKWILTKFVLRKTKRRVAPREKKEAENKEGKAASATAAAPIVIARPDPRVDEQRREIAVTQKELTEATKQLEEAKKADESKALIPADSGAPLGAYVTFDALSNVQSGINQLKNQVREGKGDVNKLKKEIAQKEKSKAAGIPLIAKKRAEHALHDKYVNTIGKSRYMRDKLRDEGITFPKTPSAAVLFKDYMEHVDEYKTELAEQIEKEKAQLLEELSHFDAAEEPAEPEEEDVERKDGEGKRGEIPQLEKPEEEEEEVGQTGEGAGLRSSEIDELMQDWPEYRGTIPRNEVELLKPIEKKNPGGFIMNLDGKNEPGSHWVAFYYDCLGDKSIEYYDPFGEPLPKDILTKTATWLSDQLDSPDLLKLKENLVKNQSVRTDTCGWHCINFLDGRASGKSFADVTGWELKVKSNVAQHEKEVAALKKEFGYI